VLFVWLKLVVFPKQGDSPKGENVAFSREEFEAIKIDDKNSEENVIIFDNKICI